MRSDRLSPCSRFRTPSTTFSTSRPRHTAECNTLASPRNRSLSCLLRVWDGAWIHCSRSSVYSFCSFVTCRYGISGAHWDSGNAGRDGRWTRPCSESPGWVVPIGISLRPTNLGPAVTFRPMVRLGPTTRVLDSDRSVLSEFCVALFRFGVCIFWIG